MRTRQRQEWFTGAIPDRSGLFAFTEMIRSPYDPERKPRGTHGTGKDAAMRWRRDLKGHPRLWGVRLAVHLQDGVPRTLNRIGVEMVDFTADIISGTALGEALWALVEAGEVEHTAQAPILFRWLGKALRAPDFEAAVRRVEGEDELLDDATTEETHA